MEESIAVAFIAGGLAVVSNMILAFTQNNKTIYRIDQLEKKVEKHNNLVERMVILEQSEKAQWSWIDKFKKTE